MTHPTDAAIAQAKPKGHGLMCVIFATDLYAAMAKDGYTLPTNGSFGPATSEFIRAHISDYMQATARELDAEKGGEREVPGPDDDWCTACGYAVPDLSATPPAQAAEASRESKMVVICRDDAGTPTVWCDPEIADLVQALNAGGIQTVASCSGHGERHGNIALADGRELLIAKDYATGRAMDVACIGAKSAEAVERVARAMFDRHCQSKDTRYVDDDHIEHAWQGMRDVYLDDARAAIAAMQASVEGVALLPGKWRGQASVLEVELRLADEYDSDRYRIIAEKNIFLSCAAELDAAMQEAPR